MPEALIQPLCSTSCGVRSSRDSDALWHLGPPGPLPAPCPWTPPHPASPSSPRGTNGCLLPHCPLPPASKIWSPDGQAAPGVCWRGGHALWPVHCEPRLGDGGYHVLSHSLACRLRWPWWLGAVLSSLEVSLPLLVTHCLRPRFPERACVLLGGPGSSAVPVGYSSPFLPECSGVTA